MSTQVAEIRVTNHSRYARPLPDFIRTVAPFKKGEVAPTDILSVPGVTGRFRGFGAPHLDGSVRMALLEGYTTAGAFQERAFPVLKGQTKPTVLNAPSGAAKPLDLQLRMGSTQPSRGTGALSADSAGFGRLGPFWYRLTLDGVPGQSMVYWQLTVGFSDPSNPSWQHTQEAALSLVAPPGTLIALWHPELKGAVVRFQPWGMEWTLAPQGTVWGDGAQQTWRGALYAVDPNNVNALAANEVGGPMVAIATNWKASGAFGPFGDVPGLPPWMQVEQQGRDWIYRELRARRPSSDLWRQGRFICSKVPGGTGDQADFGAMQGWPGALLGDPMYLDLLLPEVLQEGCRPIHHREVDGSPWLAAAHPMARFWDCRWHWNSNVSPDQGKAPRPLSDGQAPPVPYDVARKILAFSEHPDARALTREEEAHLYEATDTLVPQATFESHGWWGFDNQHWSHNYLSAAALMTGDPQLLQLCEDLEQCFLAQQLTSPPMPAGFPTAGKDASRAVGRTLLSGSQLYLVTNGQALKARIGDRVRLTVANQWDAVRISPPGARPLMLSLTDSRQGPHIPVGSLAQWPWQEALAVLGLVAVSRVTGDMLGEQIARELARTVVQFGWQERGTFDQIANCVVWNNGLPVDTNDVTKFMAADGTDFWLWAAAAVFLAEAWGWPEARDIAAGIRARRSPPGDLGFDRFGPWTAVT